MTFRKLMQGFQTFRSSYFEDSAFQELVREGQTPDTMIIACSDSRNDPANLMRSKPGEIFVVRNVAALVPPYQPDDEYHGTSAAIEFAVRGLKVKHIIILGHALCGGVQALCEHGEGKKNDFEFLTQWITIGKKAFETVDKTLPNVSKDIKLQALEQTVNLTSLNNLMTFPWVAEAVKNGTLKLHGWYFDMVGGKLLAYDFTKGHFCDLDEHTQQGTPEGVDCTPPWDLEKLVKQYVQE